MTSSQPLYPIPSFPARYAKPLVLVNYYICYSEDFEDCSFYSSGPHGVVQVIVNRSRVRSRGLEVNLPVKLTSLEKLPTVTSEIRSMLNSHPKVSLEDEKPRCHVSQVGAASFNVSIGCNLKPMVRHKATLSKVLC